MKYKCKNFYNNSFTRSKPKFIQIKNYNYFKFKKSDQEKCGSPNMSMTSKLPTQKLTNVEINLKCNSDFDSFIEKYCKLNLSSNSKISQESKNCQELIDSLPTLKLTTCLSEYIDDLINVNSNSSLLYCLQKVAHNSINLINSKEERLNKEISEINNKWEKKAQILKEEIETMKEENQRKKSTILKYEGTIKIQKGIEKDLKEKLKFIQEENELKISLITEEVKSLKTLLNSVIKEKNDKTNKEIKKNKNIEVGKNKVIIPKLDLDQLRDNQLEEYNKSSQNEINSGNKMNNKEKKIDSKPLIPESLNSCNF